MIISNRLKTIASYVKPYQYIVDIGTDHCYVPIFLAIEGSIKHAIASDVSLGPIEEAKKNIIKYQFEELIETRIGNGLDVLTDIDVVDVIIISGMGGKLITEILTNGKEKLLKNKRLILQGNIDIDVIRSYLCENHYEIVDECILKEDGKFYEIIVAEQVTDNKPLSKEERIFGPILLLRKDDVFLDKWQSILDIKKDKYSLIPPHHEKRQEFLEDIQLIEKILK